MAKFTVDLAAKLFIAKVGIVSVDAKVDLYSDAKEHWLTDADAHRMLFPFRATGGDATQDGFVDNYYFIRNGWKIRADEDNHRLEVAGNLETDAGEATNRVTVDTVGAFTVEVALIFSNRARLVDPATGVPVYTAKLGVIDDNAPGAVDRYMITWFKNGVPVTAGITDAEIQVRNATTEAFIIPAATAMTEIATTGAFRYVTTAGGQRMVDGQGYIVTCTATIDGATRIWPQWVGRDS